MRVKLFSLVPLAFSAILIAGCGGGDGPAQIPPKELYNNDRAEFNKMSITKGAQIVDARSNGAFTKVFGGTSTKDVNRFINERIKHVFGPEDESQMRYYPANLLDGTGRPADPTAARTETVAQNLSATLWRVGRIKNTSVSLYVGEKYIPITSTRSGVILLGGAYRSYDVLDDGRLHTLPMTYRMSTVSHEGRHSDCTGGFVSVYPTACGHLHVQCPSYHEFHGAYACDDETWGAYTVGAIFAQAALANLNEYNEEAAIMEMRVSDQYSRVLNYNELSIRNSSPDMSSSL